MMKYLPTIARIISFSLVLFITGSAAAQNQFKVGYIKDSSTEQPLADVLVTNQNNRKIVHTNDKGFFRIEAYTGQILFFDKDNYHFDTLRYGAMTTSDTITIFLARLPNVLAGVTVTARGLTKYQQDSIKRRLDFESVAGPKGQTVSRANSGAGIAINLDPLLKKKDRDRRKAYDTYDEIEKTNYVSYRFSRDLVGGFTGLKGDELSDFIEKYRPSYEWLRDHTGDDEVFYYVNEKLKDYTKHKK